MNRGLRQRKLSVAISILAKLHRERCRHFFRFRWGKIKDRGNWKFLYHAVDNEQYGQPAT